ncbi:hypothetical protein AB1K70_14665 [Bremerella sp. JC770]|uniref:hypothetical protein n=1 Tax=Bremerella sp. JC770 TaxID=3232137 RepID=UPI00345A001E
MNDEGWVVARLHNWEDAGLLVLSPDGKQHMLRPIQAFDDTETGFLQDEPEWHIGSTSAGPTWDESSIVLMHTFEGRPFWSMRTWWGRRIVIDLFAGEFLDEVSPLHDQSIAEQETAWVQHQLEASLSNVATARTEVENWWQVIYCPIYTAAFQAGSLKVTSAVPILQKLESCAVVAGEGTEIGMRRADQKIRLVAKASLMQIGVEPQWIANMEFRDQDFDQKLDVPEIAKNRFPEAIQVGMDLFAILREIGMPEMIRGHWDYWQFKDSKASTVRVHFKTSSGKEPGFLDYRKFVPLFADTVEIIPGFPWEVDPYVAYTLAH